MAETEIPANLIRVDPRVAEALGVTVEALKVMPLRELAERAYDAGYEWQVSSKKAPTNEGHLTIRMEDPGFLVSP